MLLDSQLCFDPAGTAVTATAASTNVLDMVNARDMGIGRKLQLLVLGNGLFAAAGAATLNIQLQGSPDNATWVTFSETGPLSIAQLNSPSAQNIDLMSQDLPGRAPGAPLPRYYRLNYVVTTGPFTAGAMQAYLTLGRDDNIAYPSGFNPAN